MDTKWLLEKDFPGLTDTEDFFAALGLSYDPHAVAVNRLHILKRFNSYLAAAELDGRNREARKSVYRACLKRAHDDFVGSSAQAQKVFAVFRKPRRNFVALTDVRQLRHENLESGQHG